jgi:hypothetical protein
VKHATAHATRKGWTVDPAHAYTDGGISGGFYDADGTLGATAMLICR